MKLGKESRKTQEQLEQEVTDGIVKRNHDLVNTFFSQIDASMLPGEYLSRYFIDAPHNKIICVKLLENCMLTEASTAAPRKWYSIEKIEFPFSYIRMARNKATTGDDFFNALFGEHSALILQSELYHTDKYQFGQMFLDYFVHMEPNFVGNTDETFRGLCICTNQDHKTMLPTMHSQESILRAVKMYPCEDFDVLDDCIAITVYRKAFLNNDPDVDFHKCIFVITIKALIHLLKKKPAWLLKYTLNELKPHVVKEAVHRMSDEETLALFNEAVRNNMVIAVNFM